MLAVPSCLLEYSSEFTPSHTIFICAGNLLFTKRRVKPGEDFPSWVLPVLLSRAGVTPCHADVLVTGSDFTCGRQAFMPIVLAQESRRVVATGPGCPC